MEKIKCATTTKNCSRVGRGRISAFGKLCTYYLPTSLHIHRYIHIYFSSFILLVNECPQQWMYECVNDFHSMRTYLEPTSASCVWVCLMCMSGRNTSWADQEYNTVTADRHQTQRLTTIQTKEKRAFQQTATPNTYPTKPPRIYS